MSVALFCQVFCCKRNWTEIVPNYVSVSVTFILLHLHVSSRMHFFVPLMSVLDIPVRCVTAVLLDFLFIYSLTNLINFVSQLIRNFGVLNIYKNTVEKLTFNEMIYIFFVENSKVVILASSLNTFSHVNSHVFLHR